MTLPLKCTPSKSLRWYKYCNWILWMSLFYIKNIRLHLSQLIMFQQHFNASHKMWKTKKEKRNTWNYIATCL